METQNYANHRWLVPMFHIVLFSLIALTLIGSLANLYQSHWPDDGHLRVHTAALIVLLTIGLLILFFCRTFALKAQDRAIRAEENLRHFVLPGKTLDPRLTIRQIIALRFASDEEFVSLVQRAAERNLSADEIKKSVK